MYFYSFPAGLISHPVHQEAVKILVRVFLRGELEEEFIHVKNKQEGGGR